MDIFDFMGESSLLQTCTNLSSLTIFESLIFLVLQLKQYNGDSNMTWALIIYLHTLTEILQSTVKYFYHIWYESMDWFMLEDYFFFLLNFHTNYFYEKSTDTQQLNVITFFPPLVSFAPVFYFFHHNLSCCFLLFISLSSKR